MNLRRWAAFGLMAGAVAAGFYGASQLSAPNTMQAQSFGDVVGSGADAVLNTPAGNGGLVRVNGAWTSLDVTGLLDVAAGDTAREFFDWNPASAVNQTGYIEQAHIYIASLSNWDSVVVSLWHRRVGNRFDYKGRVFALPVEDASVGIDTVTLATPKYAEYDWYYSARIKKAAGLAATNILTGPADANARMVSIINTVPGAVGWDWKTQTVLGTGQFRLEVEFLMRPPQIVWIGYSQFEGHDLAHGNKHVIAVGTDTTFAIAGVDSTISARFAMLRPGVTYQNNAIGGNTSDQILARFSADCAALKPRWAIIQIGGNDLATTADMLDAYADMTVCLDSCEARGILPIIVAVTPLTGKTDAEMARADSLNTAFQNLSLTHGSNPVFVSVAGALGINRGTGPSYNLWDLYATYDDGDGLHLHNRGYWAFAEAIDAALRYDLTRP